MCIICAKPIDITIPSRDTFAACFEANPDGAGIAYAHEGKVYLHKGLMTITDFNTKLEEIETLIDTQKTAMIFHFRIGTHGSKNNPIHTHPFPLVEDYETMERLNGVYDSVVVHNGVLNIGTLAGSCTKSYQDKDKKTGPSDTMEMISNILYPISVISGWEQNKKIKKLLEHTFGYNKILCLNGDGTIATLSGEFETCDGVMYSNKTYIKRVPVSTNINSQVSYDNYEPEYYTNSIKKYKDEYSKKVASIVNIARKNFNGQDGGFDAIIRFDLLRWYIPMRLTIATRMDYKTFHDFYIVDPSIGIYVNRAYNKIYVYNHENDTLTFLGCLKTYETFSNDFLYNSVLFGYTSDFRKSGALYIAPIYNSSAHYWIDRWKVRSYDIVLKMMFDMMNEIQCIESMEQETTDSIKSEEKDKSINDKRTKRNGNNKNKVIPINKNGIRQGNLLDYAKGNRYNEY